MGKDNPKGSSTDILAEAMRRVFRETVRGGERALPQDAPDTARKPVQ